jgi:hypothetical protein
VGNSVGKIKDFKTSSKEGRICEALILTTNEIHELKAMIDKNNIISVI